MRFSLAAMNRGFSPLVVHGLPFEAASLLVEHSSGAQFQDVWCISLVALWHVESSQARDKICVPCMDSYPLYQQGSSLYDFCCFKFLKVCLWPRMWYGISL